MKHYLAFTVLSVLSAQASGPQVLEGAPVVCGEVGSTWIVDRADNICGLDDPKKLSKPAKVDYEALLAATPEMKRMKEDKVDPNSPQGIQLRQTAVTRVQAAVEKARVAGGYCSVWKAIRHKDGWIVPDVTEAAKAQL